MHKHKQGWFSILISFSYYDQILIWMAFNALLHFLRKNGFNFVTQKFAEKLKNALFKRWQHSLLSSRLLQNDFLKRFLWWNFDLNRRSFLLPNFDLNRRSFLRPNFDLNSFDRFASLSQKTVSTSSLKNLQKTEKCPF